MSELMPIYSSVIPLVAHDVDINNRWKISSILSYAQEVANGHCAYLGCSWKNLMNKYRTCYVLTRMRVEMNGYPHSEENIRITTWPEDCKKAVFTRYFTFDYEDGTNLGSAVSQWVLMNTETRSIVRPSDCNITSPDTKDILPPLTMPPKFIIDDKNDSVAERIPVYSDFDYNGHVNNARYIEWICDLFPKDKFKSDIINVLDIRYIHEIRDNNPVSLKLTEKKDEPVFLVKGTDSSGNSLFECYGRWRR